MNISLPDTGIALGLMPQLLGLVYLVAFLSLLVQVRGLYGSRGILPIASHVGWLRQHFGRPAWQSYPTLFWLRADDRFLTGCAAAGAALALLLVAGVWPLPLLVLLWLLYLSFATVGREFLSYQWDALLLEAGFMTIFLALAPSPLAGVVYPFFIFRFMFSAGVVKLTSGDPNWRNLRALCYHYQTQPLPNRPGWYAHQLPEWAQKLSTLGTFFFELAVPFLALGPAPMRLAGCLLLILFQGLILTTGNYGFFNLLTIVLCVPLLDDRYLAPLGFGPAPAVELSLTGYLVSAVFLAVLLLNALQVLRLFVRPGWSGRIMAALQPWWISNPYGLFAVMTTDRFEFVIEGSADGESWLPYEFRWKPGDPARPPRQAAPHQPRLDWQMWFAALNPTTLEPWLLNLLRLLLQGSPPVLALFHSVPFPDAPPKHIRVRIYRYHFTDPATRQSSGRWWDRRELGASAPLTLRDFRKN
jgi:hypothetical protein